MEKLPNQTPSYEESEPELPTGEDLKDSEEKKSAEEISLFDQTSEEEEKDLVNAVEEAEGRK